MGNWFLYLLIIFLLFNSDGTMDVSERAVMTATLIALTMTNGASTDENEENNSASTNCFCNHTI